MEISDVKEKEILRLAHRYAVFIDETGDPKFHRDIGVYDNPSVFPVLTVTAVIIPVAVYRDITMPQIDELKRHFFGAKDIYFHSKEIRNKDGIYKVFLDQEMYSEFKERFDGIIERSSIRIISCSINKKRLLQKADHFRMETGNEYDIGDIYLRNVDYILERLGHFLGDESAKIIFETRGKKESKRIQGVLDDAKEKGTFYCGAERFRGIDPDIAFFQKKDNVNGLQLADYCTYPFARHAKNNSDEDNRFFDFLRKFVYKGDYGEYGLKEWP